MLVRSPATSVLRPAVVMLHGYTATPEGEETVTGWTALSEQHGVLVAYPQGTPTIASGFGWTTGAAHDATTGTDDVDVVARVVQVLETMDCVDPSQIVIAGESNGSGLGLLVACDSSTKNSIALFALAIPAVDVNVLQGCKNASPFPLLVMAGTEDATVPLHGGSVGGQPPFSAPLTWFKEIAKTVNGCRGFRSKGTPDAVHFFFDSCIVRADFYEIVDGHHTWPGGPPGAGGLAPGAFPASSLALCRAGVTMPVDPLPCSVLLGTFGLS